MRPLLMTLFFITTLNFQTLATARDLDPQSIHSVAHIDLIPQEIKRVAEPFKIYLETAPKEKGSLEIRLLQQTGAPNHLTLVEVWSDKKAYEAHLAAKSTRAFKQAIAPYLGSPYDERLHTEAVVFEH